MRPASRSAELRGLVSGFCRLCGWNAFISLNALHRRGMGRKLSNGNSAGSSPLDVGRHHSPPCPCSGKRTRHRKGASEGGSFLFRRQLLRCQLVGLCRQGGSGLALAFVAQHLHFSALNSRSCCCAGCPAGFAAPSEAFGSNCASAFSAAWSPPQSVPPASGKTRQARFGGSG